MKNPKIYSYSVVYSSSVEFQDRTPYACAILEGEDGERASCILSGYTPGMEISIGMPVRECGETEAGAPIYSL